MAFYEMLPGAGMPPGLQAGMDSVLNKKFGTSTTYPAEDWPDTVNLMGPLPEKTVSGAIVTFPDGADEVPLKKCEITLPTSLDGYSSVNVIHAGKNLWEFGDKTVDTVAYIMLYFTKPLPAGTYTVSCELTSTTTTCSFRFRKEDGSYLVQTSFTANAGRVSQTLTLPEPAYRVYLYSSTQAGGEVTTWKNVQIEVGATMTDFVAYTAPTTHTAQLGRTIHGGTVDVVSGQGESTFAKGSKALADFTVGATVGDYTAYTYAGYMTESVNNNNKQVAYIGTTQIQYTYQGIGANTTHFYIGTNGQINLYLPNDWSDFEHDVEAVAELATPETFTFTPITPTPETALGVNNFWADSGDSEVTYRADIDLLLGGI